jgi:alcohol dehydrogenase class IV|tara:strand:- start:17695 stop:18039 length:345 start_codon:yes stop_codon:yes gene_type:complete
MKPKAMKIGHRRFKIKYIPYKELQKLHDSDEEIYALLDSNDCIYLDEAMGGTTMADAFLHECIHAFNHVLGIEYPKEENVANSMAAVVVTLWADNKKAFKWWASLIYMNGDRPL